MSHITTRNQRQQRVFTWGWFDTGRNVLQTQRLHNSCYTVVRGTWQTICSQQIPQTPTLNWKHDQNFIKLDVSVSLRFLSTWVNRRKRCWSPCLPSTLVLCVWISPSANRDNSPADLEDSDSWWDVNSNPKNLSLGYLPGLSYETCFADMVQPCFLLASHSFAPFSSMFFSLQSFWHSSSSPFVQWTTLLTICFLHRTWLCNRNLTTETLKREPQCSKKGKES